MTIEAGQVYRHKAGSIYAPVTVLCRTSRGLIVIERADGSVRSENEAHICAEYELVIPKIVRYVNVYAGKEDFNSTREKADIAARGATRIACIRIEFEKGQMDP